jgi:hypothetical protein
VGEGRLQPQSTGVVPGGGQQLPSDLRADAGQLEQGRRGGLNERMEFGVQLGDLLAQLLVAASEVAQRRLGGR